MVTTGGALLSALVVAKLAPEATGHGTDGAIEAVHSDPRAIRFRVVLVKMVASALTIGAEGFGRPGRLTGWTAMADAGGHRHNNLQYSFCIAAKNHNNSPC